MKQFHHLALALGLMAAGANAQNVTVVLNDGSAHRIPAEEIKQITFVEEETPEIRTTTFNKITVNPYSNGNVTLIFSNNEDGIEAVIDTYGPTDETYLQPGLYTGSTENTPMTFDLGQYSYVTVGDSKLSLTEGTLNIALDGTVYNMTLDATLSDGSLIHGVYKGELDTFGPFYEVTLSTMKYAYINNKIDGEIFVKANDANWSCEAAFDFICAPGSTTLQPGTYTYSDSKEQGHFTNLSYVDTYSPSSNNKFTSGEIKVEQNGENYTITVNGTFADGRIAVITFNGTIAPEN